MSINDLINQLKATNESIEHWEDIVKKILKGRKIQTDNGILRWQENHKRVECYAQDCPLCRLTFNKRFKIRCKLCPLYKFTELKCNDDYSSWQLFIKYPDKTTAINMVNTLKLIKIILKLKLKEMQ